VYSVFLEEWKGVIVRQFHTLTGAQDYVRCYLLEHEGDVNHRVIAIVGGDVIEHAGSVIVVSPDEWS
jgi:hypothetical protein